MAWNPSPEVAALRDYAAMDRLGPMEEVLRAVGALVRAERAFREVCERTEAQCEAVRKGGYA